METDQRGQGAKSFKNFLNNFRKIIVKRNINILVLGAVLASASMQSFSEELQIDLTSDDFGVLTHITDKYIEKHVELDPFKKKSTFGMGYTSFNDNVFPKVGFVGYQFTDDQGKDRLLKLQLFKDDSGWSVVNILSNDKIHQANPTYTFKTDHFRSKQSRRAKIAAAKASEAWFNRQGIIPQVRSTYVRCYMTKDGSKASCHTVYGLKKDDKVSCFSKSYLMERQQDVWSMVKEIHYDQKVSYSTGELETIKPFSMHCS